MTGITTISSIVAGNTGHRQRANAFDVQNAISEKREEIVAGRLDVLTQRMLDATRTARRMGRSAAPTVSARCRTSVSASGSPASSSGRLGAALDRSRRHTGGAQIEASPTSTFAPDLDLDLDVVSEPVPGLWQMRTRYTLADVLRALGSCDAPFMHASELADEMFALSTHPRFTAERRALLTKAAGIVDQLSALAPQVFTLHSICNVFRIAADLLDGKAMTAGDVMDVNMFGRQLLTFKRVAGPIYRVTGALQTGESNAGERKAHEPQAGEPQAADIAFGALGRALTTLEIRYREGAAPVLDAMPEARVLALPAVEDAAIRDIAAAIGRARTQWTRLGAVPIRRSTRVRGHWETIPVSEYRVPNIDMRNRVPGALFDVAGRRYLSLEGYAVAVRTLGEGDLWIVDARVTHDSALAPSDHLPPLPLRQEAERWIVQSPSIEPVDSALPMVVGRDGFFRYQNRKFVTIGGVRVEVPRATIDGEQEIAHFAQPLLDVLPGADAMQIIRLPDGNYWIEGASGYYRLRFDLDRQDFYITDAHETQTADRAFVDFDVQRTKWTAMVAPRESDYAREGLGGDVDRQAQQALHGEAHIVPAHVSSESAAPSNSASFSRMASRAGPLPEGWQDWPDGLLPSIDTDVHDPFAGLVEEADDVASHIVDGEASLSSPPEPWRHEGLPVFETTRTGLEREFALFAHHARHLKRYAFFSSPQPVPHLLLRRALRRRLYVAFHGLEATAMVAVNRLEPYARRALTPVVLSLRRRINSLYPPDRMWRVMTVQEKQYEVAQLVRIAYRQTRSEMWPCLVGYCNEIADLMLYALTARKSTLRRHMMQIALRDEDGLRATHVMLAYADEPAAFDVFGDLATRDIDAQRAGSTLDEVTFCEWLLTNRDNVLLIDAWATNKIVDLTRAETVIDVRGALLSNLMEAGFDVYDMPRFKVRTLLPERPRARTN